MTKNVKFFLLLTGFFFLTFGLGAQSVKESAPTLMKIVIDSQSLYENYLARIKDLNSLQGREQVETLNFLARDFFKQANFDLGVHIQEFLAFNEQGLINFTGPIRFWLDEKSRPNLVFKGECKPSAFFSYLNELFLEPEQFKSAKVEEDFAELAVPGPDFDMVLRLATDSIYLTANDLKSLIDKSGGKDEKDSKALLKVEIDFNLVKELVALKAREGRRTACFANQMALKNAVELYQLETGEVMKELKTEILRAKNYILPHLVCSEGGSYMLEKDGDLRISCSIHGNLKKPRSGKVDVEKEIDPRLRPFQAFRLLVRKEQIQAEFILSDPNQLEQWLAISKQQILTLKHLIADKQLPENFRKDLLKITDSIRCRSDESRLFFCVEELDESKISSLILVCAEAFRVLALPKMKRARKIEKAPKEIKQIFLKEEEF